MNPDPEPPPEEPWRVNEYRFETPFWMELLFSPWMGGFGVPLIVLIAIVLWRWLG